MGMRILYLSQYFPPEIGATQTRALEMARFLVRQGHEVTVVAEIPNHPSGIIKPGFRGSLYKKRLIEGIEVLYVWVTASPRKTFGRRLLFYFSFMVNAILAGLVACRGPFDLIYATSPPLLVAGAGLGLHWLRRIPFLFEVRDLWPTSAIALGELRNPHAIRLALALEGICYEAARRVIVVTEGIQRQLRKRGIEGKKIVLIPNGANVDDFRRDEVKGRALRRSLALENKMVVLYAGLLGVAQRLDTMLQAARILSTEPRYQFIVLGEGPEAESLKALSYRLRLKNIRFLGERPREEMPAYYSASDATLVPLRRIDLFLGARPSKMFDAWACETPILLGIDGESRDILEKAGGGFSYRPEDADDLARVIRDMDRLGEAARRAMGRKARGYVETYHSRLRYAVELERVLSESLSELR